MYVVFKKLFSFTFLCLLLQVSISIASEPFSKKQVEDVFAELRKNTLIEDFLSLQTPEGYNTLIECFTNPPRCNRHDAVAYIERTLMNAYESVENKKYDPFSYTPTALKRKLALFENIKTIHQLSKKQSIESRRLELQLKRQHVPEETITEKLAYEAFGKFEDNQQLWLLLEKHRSSEFRANGLSQLCAAFMKFLHIHKIHHPFFNPYP